MDVNRDFNSVIFFAVKCKALFLIFFFTALLCYSATTCADMAALIWPWDLTPGDKCQVQAVPRFIFFFAMTIFIGLFPQVPKLSGAAKSGSAGHWPLATGHWPLDHHGLCQMVVATQVFTLAGGGYMTGGYMTAGGWLASQGCFVIGLNIGIEQPCQYMVQLDGGSVQLCWCCFAVEEQPADVQGLSVQGWSLNLSIVFGFVICHWFCHQSVDQFVIVIVLK